MTARALQELAEPLESRGAQAGIGTRRNLSLSCNIASCIYFTSEHGSGMQRFASVEAGLLCGYVRSQKQPSDGPFGHDVAGQHGTKQLVAEPAGQDVVEEGRLCGREGQAARE